MARRNAEEMINFAECDVLGETVSQEPDTASADVQVENAGKRRNLRRSGSDPSPTNRGVISRQSGSRPGYQLSDVASSKDGPIEPPNTDRGSTRTRRTRFLQPLYVRAVRDPRFGREMPGYITMSRENRPFSSVTVSPERFLASQSSPYISHLLSAVQSTDDGLQHKNIRLSRRLPGWVWYLLAKSVGIKLHQNDKPIFATLLHVFTLTTAFLFGITGAWYTVRDILSEYSKTTVLIGTVRMMIGFGWILLGVYAHKLTGKLFGNKNFAESVRMHSKTFLKISTAGLMVIMGYALVGINSYDCFGEYSGSACTKIQLLPIVCHLYYVSKTLYAFICVCWTMLVGFVLLSVCRTHTIGIRRFMREMMMDAKAYESFWMENMMGQASSSSPDGEDIKIDEEWFIWDDQANNCDYDSPVVTSQSVFLESIKGTTYIPRPRSFKERVRGISARSETLSEQEEITAEQLDGNSADKDDGTDSEHNPVVDSTALLEPPIISNNDLLFSYWKVMRRLVMTSRFLQRWLSSWISFIFCWCAYYIIFWANHSATLVGILQFVFPLLLLLIVCSAYAEVNAEGQRLLKCIIPTQERLRLLSYLGQQPLQMQVFSFPITYNAIMGVILAFSVAFASRIVLDEVL